MTPTPANQMSPLRAIVGLVSIVLLVLYAYGTIGPNADKAMTSGAPDVSLESQMTVTVTSCRQDGASGKVVNGSGSTVDLYIQTNYLASDGTVLDDGIDNVSGVRAGETANWDAGYFGGEKVYRCRAVVGSAFAQ